MITLVDMRVPKKGTRRFNEGLATGPERISKNPITKPSVLESHQDLDSLPSEGYKLIEEVGVKPYTAAELPKIILLIALM